MIPPHQIIMDEPPPPYSASPPTSGVRISPRLSPRLPSLKTSRPNSSCGPQNQAKIKHLPEPVHRFPKEFGFYRAAGSASDFIISYHADDPHILFYISIHAGTSKQPSVVLHALPHASAPYLATANLHVFSETAAINIYDSPTSVIKAQSAETSDSSMVFIVQLPGSGSKVQFAWRQNQERDLISLDSRNNGLKLVNCDTGEIVATWTRPSFSTKKLGKMNFLVEDRSRLGERFELMAVITILSIMERERRKRINSV
ncbi:hypothetical protein BGT96224_2734 [Blumeria graminis f. sp. tritici 96224]|uniref:Uncharacterized protein n=1 Tax=Blumeria graminis f. sp. tritici 96224 TaxID=1268274 RepID=A0A656KKA3_BLUGR|nr:hypothetical protein BGT96224_2734 [Blumeria graminis f. sp. tritici 96224]